MVEPQTAAELARLLADVLERHGLPYAIGGAIALGFYAPPRARADSYSARMRRATTILCTSSGPS